MSYLSPDSQSSSNAQKTDDGEKNEDLEVDNSKSVLLKIATLYAEQLMSDITLEVGGKEFPAHRIILCASSEVFQVMLMNREWSEWRESRIVLQETPQEAAVFPHFLKYFYTGQIRISHATVLPVLTLADKYNVKDLATLCLRYMSQHAAQAARRGHIISWMQYTMAAGHTRQAKLCQNFVKWNLEWVLAESSLEELEGETLVQLLRQSDLVLHNEMTLHQLVVRWLGGQRTRLTAADMTEAERVAHWESLVVAVFSHVRFPMMGPNQLAKLLLCPLAQEHKDFFMERMAIAMSYQSGQFERVAEIQRTEAGRALFTPRLYTEDTWGSVLAVDNFHSLPCYHTRTFIFSTRSSMSDACGSDRALEWTVDLYPRGVWFRKALLIVWAGTCDVPEVVLRTVRISITCQNCPEGTVNQYGEVEEPEADVRVKIGVLVWGVAQGVEYVSSAVERVHRFSASNRVLNIDGSLDFDSLNTPLYTPADTENPPGPNNTKGRCARCSDGCDTAEPRHLLGPNRDQLKIQVVIVPLTDYCHVSPEETG